VDNFRVADHPPAISPFPAVVLSEEGAGRVSLERWAVPREDQNSYNFISHILEPTPINNRRSSSLHRGDSRYVWSHIASAVGSAVGGLGGILSCHPRADVALDYLGGELAYGGVLAQV
jgi:hypothetical protein